MIVQLPSASQVREGFPQAHPAADHHPDGPRLLFSPSTSAF